ncbi:MAG TPA: hypothetical protein PK957_02360 [Candidatus Dojkabacteria bacterium]|nr:hypothetical protein [Candidatus Dojkabacteria bacterium]HQF36399.1 hypothetical protein [Candidatus Dojkabacteria bacterium]
MNVFDLFIVIASLANLLVGFLVLTKSNKDNYNLKFAHATFGVSIGGFSTILLNYYTNMFWERVLFTSSIAGVFLLHLILTNILLRRIKRLRI